MPSTGPTGGKEVDFARDVVVARWPQACPANSSVTAAADGILPNSSRRSCSAFCLSKSSTGSWSSPCDLQRSLIRGYLSDRRSAGLLLHYRPLGNVSHLSTIVLTLSRKTDETRPASECAGLVRIEGQTCRCIAGPLRF